MDFRELNYVLAIEKYHNITKAAESLYVSQPTLSKFLANLEHDLGQKLFRKLGNKYILTFAGQKYVDTAREILLLKSNLDIELADILKKM
ncbi:MAG: LysR family transcriptional regulator [Enterocloster sp.]